MEINLLTTIANENEAKINIKYLLQINRIKLLDYIQYGIIAPDKYFDDEIEVDIQSKNKNFLVLTDGYFDKLDEQQVLIELILTDDEIDKLNKQGEIFYCEFPLPISRIKKVYAKNKPTIKHISSNIHTSECGFLPESLFDTFIKNRKEIFQQKLFENIDNNVIAKNYEVELRKFNKRMGMFSFVKNNNIYYFNDRKSISNFSDHYFVLLNTLLETKSEENEFSELKLLSINSTFKNLLDSDLQIDKDLVEQIRDTIENTDIRELFDELLKPNSILKTLPKLFELDNKVYFLIGLVYYFRQKESNKKDSFKSDIQGIIPFEISEISLIVLGLYLGYNNLRASENFELKDNDMKNIFGDTFNIKFQLNSELDYIAIETIYNFSFHGKKGYKFDYLDYPTSPKALKVPVTEKFKIWHNISTKEQYDIKNIKIQKLSFQQIVIDKLNKYNDDKIILGKDHIFSFAAKYFPTIINTPSYSEKFQLFCDKKDLLELLKKEESNTKQNQIFNLFKADDK